MFKWQILSAAVLLGALAASPAQADCRGQDLAGLYETYADFGGFWTRCNIKILPDGRLKVGERCVDSLLGSGQVIGGELRVTGPCTVTGRIEISINRPYRLLTDSGKLRIDLLINHAQFDRRKHTIAGVGGYQVLGFADGAVTFNAVRGSEVAMTPPAPLMTPPAPPMDEVPISREQRASEGIAGLTQ